MTEKKRIACFFTGGYTELHAMKLFIGKINDSANYIQLHPHRQRKNKDDIKNRHRNALDSEQSGRTGDALISYVLDFIEKDIFLDEHYDAILIEDDKDDRFLSVQRDGSSIIDEDSWNREYVELIAKIHDKRPDIPVILFCAAPEIEAWLLSDWDNSFGLVYSRESKGPLTAEQNNYFNVKFRSFVNGRILTPKYRDNIEAYGYFDGSYKKLSQEIQDALNEIDFWEGYDKPPHEPIRYSKRKEGSHMLEEINPNIVVERCGTFFKRGYLALREI